MLARLADYLEAREALRQKVVLALIYPAIVTVIAFAVIARVACLRGAAGGFGLPAKPADAALAHAGVDHHKRVLPRDRMAVAGTRRGRGGGVRGWPTGVRHFARAGMRGCCACPSPASLREASTRRASRSTLAILVGSGAPLLRSLDAASEVVHMTPLRRAAQSAAALVREGVTLSRALKEQAQFPPVLIHLVGSGESSGRLGPMLERAAEELERDAERRLAWLAALLQPALIVVMGAIVLVLVLAVMLPIVSMNQLIR